MLYERLLRQWQKAVNLVAPATLDALWHRHFADTAQLLFVVPSFPGETWLDLGSGAGFPGLVLAILLGERQHESPPPHVFLVESDTRKAAFLREAARQTGAAATILPERVEKLATRGMNRSIHRVTARAFAPLPRLLDLAEPFFGPATAGIFPKGRSAAREVAEARTRFTFECDLKPSVTEAEASILVVRRLARISKRAQS